MSLRTFSYGGGWQSNAVLVLAAQGKVDYPVFLFSNVGDDSEHPDTLTYVRDIAMPYAAEHGIELHELHRIGQRGPRKGQVETLYERLTREGSRSLPIPVRMGDTGAPGTRSCTAEFKLKVIARWLQEHGASEEDPAAVGIGFSTDEVARIESVTNRAKSRPFERVEFPLIDLGISRAACAGIITGAGLPMPPKSACWFCPMHRPSRWKEMQRDEPELFERSVALERLLNQRREMLGKDPVYLTRFGKPLDEAMGDHIQPSMLPLIDEGDGPGAYGCDSGGCFT